MSSNSTKTLKLNTKNSIPAVGLGTWQSEPDEVYNAVLTAIKAGYRHIDAAWIYGNEKEVGKAIKDSGIARDELFVTSKLWNTDHGRVEKALDTSLENLGLDYLDLYLIHWPIPFNPNGNDPKIPKKRVGGVEKVDILDDPEDFIKTWKLLESVFKKGSKVKSIGVSNFTTEQLTKLLKELEVVPAALQIENHPYLPQHELVEFAKKHGILVEAYSPLGSTGAPVLKDATIESIAKKYNVSAATILISWQVWRGLVVLPKSVHKERVIDNLKIVDLSDEDGEKINDIHKTTKKRINDPGEFWDYDLFATEE